MTNIDTKMIEEMALERLQAMDPAELTASDIIAMLQLAVSIDQWLYEHGNV